MPLPLHVVHFIWYIIPSLVHLPLWLSLVADWKGKQLLQPQLMSDQGLDLDNILLIDVPVLSTTLMDLVP